MAEFIPRPAEVMERKGFCQCGCGQRTNIATVTQSSRGIYAGAPNRFVLGHSVDLATYEAKTEARFWERVEKSTSGCWLWTGALDKWGYSYFRVGREAVGRKTLGHRYSYWLAYGDLPDLDLDHLCRVRHCVNPEHLEPVTRAENIRRGLRSPDATACINGHDYTPENTYRRPDTGSRICRTCNRESSRRHREAS